MSPEIPYKILYTSETGASNYYSISQKLKQHNAGERCNLQKTVFDEEIRNHERREGGGEWEEVEEGEDEITRLLLGKVIMLAEA